MQCITSAEGRRLCLRKGLCLCMSVGKISQKVVNGFWLNVLEGWDVSQGTVCWILFVIRIQEFLKVFFIYYCDFHRQPKIKHDNPRWKYALYTERSVVVEMIYWILYIQTECV